MGASDGYWFQAIVNDVGDTHQFQYIDDITIVSIKVLQNSSAKGATLKIIPRHRDVDQDGVVSFSDDDDNAFSIDSDHLRDFGIFNLQYRYGVRAVMERTDAHSTANATLPTFMILYTK